MTEPITPVASYQADYAAVHADIVTLLEGARRAAARSVNALMTASYWEIGRRIVEFEQGGKDRAEYGQALLKRLSADLSARFGRGFGVDSLESMRLFYQTYSPERISESVIRKLPADHQPPNSEPSIRNFDLKSAQTRCARL